MKKKIRYAAVVFAAAAVFILCVHCLVVFRLIPLTLLSVVPLHPIELARPDETEVLDTDLHILRHIPAKDGTRSRPVKARDMPLNVIDAFLAAEDRRFLSHGGYDPLAIIRAMKSNLSAGRIVSGASTITQQLVRISYPRKRTVLNKCLEILAAIKTEHLLTKQEILRHYLNRVPMGKNIHGVALACEKYFKRPLSFITLEEAALLAAIPQSPGRVDTPAGRKQLKKRQQWILQRMYALTWISDKQLKDALSRDVLLCEPQWDFEAPHFTELVLAKTQGQIDGEPVKTTLNLGFQKSVENIMRSRAPELKENNCTQLAVVVLENATSAIRAMAGSLGVTSTNDGWNNGTRAYRSAGSSLKPFAFALAIDRGYDAATVLKDVRRSYATPLSDYRPLNFSRNEHGPVLMRAALGASLNLPAVDLLKKVGVHQFFLKLKDLGFVPIVDNDAHYGLGLVIGNLEVRLLNLCAAFSTLARGGLYAEPVYLEKDAGRQKLKRVFSREAAYIVTDMLSDPGPRVMAFGRPWYLNYRTNVAMKTGTSTSFRDCWMVAYTPQYTVGCWAGNFNGAPTKQLTGAKACGPIIHDILENVLPHSANIFFDKPESVVEKDICSVSGGLPGPSCTITRKELFIADQMPVRTCSFHRQEEPELVFLGSEYAHWQSKQSHRGLIGRYRLEGYDVPLTMEDYRQHQQTETAQKEPLKPSTVVHLGSSHFSVGDFPEKAALIQIRSPLSVDRFVYDPSRPSEEQVIRLEVELSEMVSTVTWYINGVPFAEVGPPYTVYWPLKRGQHTIVAACPDGTGDKVVVTVE